jgi:hypothetical protein
VLLLCLAGCASLYAHAAKARTFTAEQAKDHVGERATVCRQVVSPHYAYKPGGHPTFLNFDQPYPHQVFTVLIWGKDGPKFGEPEKRYRNKRICVTGTITVLRGVPEIVVQTP